MIGISTYLGTLLDSSIMLLIGIRIPHAGSGGYANETIYDSFASRTYDLDEPVAEDPIEEYQYASNASADISISNSGTATFIANAKGQIGIATKISGTCYLQKLKNGTWKNIKSVENTTNSLSLTLSSSKSNLANGKYRTHAVFKVYSGSDYETVTVNSSSVYY